MVRIFLGRMEEEKSPTRTEQIRKTIDLVVLTTDGVSNPEITKAVDRELAVNTVKILQHAKWWQAQDDPPMQKVTTAVISVII